MRPKIKTNHAKFKTGVNSSQGHSRASYMYLVYCTCQLLIPCCHSHRPCARVGQLQPSLVLIRPISDFRITMVLLVQTDLSVNSSNLHVCTFACGKGEQPRTRQYVIDLHVRGLIGMSYLYNEKCKTETGRQGRFLGLGQQEPFSLRVFRLATISLSGIYN